MIRYAQVFIVLMVLVGRPVFADPCSRAVDGVMTVASVRPDGTVVAMTGDRYLPYAVLTLAWRLPPAVRHKNIKQWAELVVGKRFHVQTVARKADRYGRTTAILWDEQSPPQPMAAMMLDRGWAVMAPLRADQTCIDQLLPAENRARHAQIGLWASPKMVHAATDTKTLLEWQNSVQLVTGTIRSVGVRTRQVYLNFGLDWDTDFTVVMTKDIWQAVHEKFSRKSRLDGRRVLVRGVVQARGGPSIRLYSAQSLLLLD